MYPRKACLRTTFRRSTVRTHIRFEYGSIVTLNMFCLCPVAITDLHTKGKSLSEPSTVLTVGSILHKRTVRSSLPVKRRLPFSSQESALTHLTSYAYCCLRFYAIAERPRDWIHAPGMPILIVVSQNIRPIKRASQRPCKTHPSNEIDVRMGCLHIVWPE